MMSNAWPQIAFREISRAFTVAGAYVMHLYCKYENPDHSFREFPHEPEQVNSEAQARRWARDVGWVLHRDGTATCPKCAARLRRGDKPAPPPSPATRATTNQKDTQS